MANDYEAKVINISANLSDKELLKKLCKDHIVVVAAPNSGSEGGWGFDTWMKEALQEDPNVRKHLLAVINVMPDGVTLSPSTAIPGSNPIVQESTVAAPGTWVESTIPDPNPRPEDFSERYAMAGLQEKPQHGSWEEMSGTSQATPVVTGLVIRLLANFPKLSLEEVVQIVKDSANKTGDLSNKNYFGQGRIDVSAAYNLAAKK